MTSTTKAQKVRIGIFMAIAAGLLALIVIVFGGMQFWKGTTRYRVDFDDTVMGLERGAPVHLNGIRVGTVDEIGVSSENLQKVTLLLIVEQGTPVRTDTEALLQLAGITGVKVIDLRSGTLTAPQLPEGGTIPQGAATLDMFEKQAKDIAERSTKLMDKAQQMIDNLVAVTDPKKFQVTTDNLNATTTELRDMVAENRVAIRQTVKSINATAKSLNTTAQSANETARAATAVLDGEVGQLVANASDFVTQLKGMVTNNSGALRSAVYDLRQASRSFKDMAREVRQRPSRLLFSTPAGDRKLP